MVNTGWVDGPSETNCRISLKITRQLVTSAVSGDLNNVEYENLDIFNLKIPIFCPNIDNRILNPKNIWKSPNHWESAAIDLKFRFDQNFEKYI